MTAKRKAQAKTYVRTTASLADAVFVVTGGSDGSGAGDDDDGSNDGVR